MSARTLVCLCISICSSISIACIMSLPGFAAAQSEAAAAPPSAQSEAAAVSLREFVDASYAELIRRDPDSLWASSVAAAYGIEGFSEWTEISLEEVEARAALARGMLEDLRAYEVGTLSQGERIVFDAYEWFLQDLIARAEYPYWDYMIGMSSYGVHNLALELAAELPIEDEASARAYIRRIEGIDEWMAQLIDVYRAREASGVIPTEYAIEMTLAELDELFPPGDAGEVIARSLPVYTSFVDRLAGVATVSGNDRVRFQNELIAAIAAHLVPAYRTLRDYVASLAGRGTAVGVMEYVDAAEYYRYFLAHHITKPMAPEQVHAIGLREVARLQQEMRAYACDVLGWPAGMTMDALEARITQQNQPILQGEALLAEYQSYVDEVEPLLPAYFGTLPESELVITVDPDGPAAYYREPPIDKSGPGQIVTSLFNMTPYTAYDEPVLMHHEGIPGHHFQIALSRDLDLPDFQRDLIMLGNVYFRHPLFQAYVEGWALYAERLAAEMGVYQDDPLGGLCQKRLELARLVRLVTDTGLNAMGWTWAEAQSYSREATGRSEPASRQMHYDGYPGQVTIGIGYVLLLELRQRAMDELGDAFDIRAFHDAILVHGAVPFSTLEWIVDEWIAETLAGA